MSSVNTKKKVTKGSYLEAINKKAVAGAFALSLGVGLAIPPIAHGAADEYTIVDHKTNKNLSGATNGRTVQQALLNSGVEVSATDFISPSLETPLEDGMKINVYPQKDVTIKLQANVSQDIKTSFADSSGEDTSVSFFSSNSGKETKKFKDGAITIPADNNISRKVETDPISTHVQEEISAKTHAKTVGQVLESQGIDVTGKIVEPPLGSTVKDGASIVIKDTGFKIRFFDGKNERNDLKAFPEEHLGDFLKRNKIPFDKDDITSIPLDAPMFPDQEVHLDRVEHLDILEKFVVEPPIKNIDDPNEESGQVFVDNPGKPGEGVARIHVVKVNGEETERKEVGRDIKVPAEEKVVRTGSKKPPAPAPSVANNAPPSTPTTQDAIWRAIGECESGNNPRTNTGNGFEGMYQFTNQTWLAYGGGQYAQHAYDATADQQLEIAKKVQQGQGWGAWPGCTSRLGLR